jgi:hypothetical protein
LSLPSGIQALFYIVSALVLLLVCISGTSG